MDPGIVEDLIVFAGLMSLLGALTKITLTLINRRKSPLDNTRTAALLEEIAQRLERVEQAVDTTAVEVERISEGQRFTTKLLAERERSPSEP